MFFRAKQAGKRKYLQIVENEWKDGASRQRVVATVGRLDKIIESGTLESLIQSGSKFCKSSYNDIFAVGEEVSLSSHQAGRVLQVSPSTVVGWVNQGRLPAHRTPGGHRRVKIGDLRRFIEQSQMPVPADLRSADEQTRRIFIVDDDPVVVRTMKRAFELHGDPAIEVQGCSDGIEALVLIGAMVPDLVLLDLFMPDMDGFEVCRRLRQLPHLEGLRIVAMTAHASPEARQRILDAGASACWVKPVAAEQVVALLREHADQRSTA